MEAQFKQAAAMIGDPTRATILWTLMEGKSLTATELAIACNTTPQNISMHLQKLLQAEMLQVESQGRHRYYRFSRTEIAYAIEALIHIAPSEPAVEKTVQLAPIKYCRSCYDHLAGKVSVALTDSLLRQRILVYEKNTFDVTPKGVKWFQAQGIDCKLLRSKKRAFARPCLDWSERRHHLGGALGAALFELMLNADWLRRTAHSRVVVVTGKGMKKLQHLLPGFMH